MAPRSESGCPRCGPCTHTVGPGAVPSNIGTPGANGGHRRASSSAVAAVTSASAPSDAGRFPSGGRRRQPRGRRGRVGGAYAEAGAAGGGRTPCRVASRATLRLAVCRARRIWGAGDPISCERASAVPAEGGASAAVVPYRCVRNHELQFVDRRASLRTFHLRRRFDSSDDVGTRVRRFAPRRHTFAARGDFRRTTPPCLASSSP